MHSLTVTSSLPSPRQGEHVLPLGLASLGVRMKVVHFYGEGRKQYLTWSNGADTIIWLTFSCMIQFKSYQNCMFSKYTFYLNNSHSIDKHLIAILCKKQSPCMLFPDKDCIYQDGLGDATVRSSPPNTQHISCSAIDASGVPRGFCALLLCRTLSLGSLCLNLCMVAKAGKREPVNHILAFQSTIQK